MHYNCINNNNFMYIAGNKLQVTEMLGQGESTLLREIYNLYTIV
jgi:hypothetical protein